MEEKKDKKELIEEKITIQDTSINIEEEEEDKGIGYELIIGKK